MPPRKSPEGSPKPGTEVEQRVARLTEFVEKMNEEMETGIRSLLDTMEKMVEEVRILRIAIDDARAEMEWTMRNHAPKRAQPIGLPLKSLPKPDPRLEPDEMPESIACERCDAADPGSIAAAEKAGWTNITEYDGPGRNYVGLCGDCQKALVKEKEQEQAVGNKQKSLFS